MDLITLGRKCIKESMKVLEKASVEIVQFKGPAKNIQIAADVAAQEAIKNVLKNSGQGFIFISEEEKEPIKTGLNPEVEAYTDPLDGSSFFLVGHKRFCCTALMFVCDGKVLASFVGDLITGDIYHCDEQFAYLNNKKLSFSFEKKGERYFVATYVMKGSRIKNELPKLVELAQEKILIFNNSGPLEHAFVTTGQFDAVIDLLPIGLWDFCGTAIAQKAGAIVTTREGTPFRYENIKQTAITARNPEIHKMLLGAFNKKN